MPETSDNDRDLLRDVPAVRRAAHALQTPVEMRPEWRESLLHEIDRSPTPSAEHGTFVLWRPVVVRPVYAVAACLVALIVGAAGQRAWSRAQQSQRIANAATGFQENRPMQLRSAASKQTIVRFALVAPGARRVSVVGDFNGWNAGATPMNYVQDGNAWLIDMPLSAGRHLYAFVVDGDLVADPSAARVVDDDFGVQNSVILVGAP